MDLCVEEWDYFNEGSVHLLLQHRHTPNLLRLRVEGTPENWEQREVDFCERVVAPLLGRSYVDAGVLVPLPPHFLEQVASRIQSCRPVHRVHRSLDRRAMCGVLVQDLSVFSCALGSKNERVALQAICVEIKPKWGFLPSSAAIHPDNSLKRCVCRYCMHQQLKIDQGDLVHKSAYCPLDLYSGKEDRIRHALCALWETPQNNLRLFVGGQMCMGGSGRSTDPLMRRDLLDQTLASWVTQALIPPSHDTPDALMINALTAILYREPLLSRIRRVQRLDEWDIEGIAHVYEAMAEDERAVCDDTTSWSLSEVYTTQGGEDVCLGASSRGKIAVASERDIARREEALLHIDAMDRDRRIETVRRFLLAATLKDCSIMITMVPLASVSASSNHFSSVCLPEGMNLAYQIHVIDLDARPSSFIPRYADLDQRIVTHFCMQ